MIIDCFPFFDELDLLEVRLNELNGIVDVFVLTESPLTFSGIGKPLYFKNNQDRFKKFPIVHTVYNRVEKCPPMEMERRQKQFNLDSAFELFKPGDVLIQGDLDEIPKAAAVEESLTYNCGSVRLVMDVFYYYINCKEVSGKKRVYKNSRVLRPEKPIKYNAKQNDKTDKIIWNAGWHFSYLGDIKKKLAAWGHADQYNKPPYNTSGHIRKCKEEGLDLIMRTGKRKMEFKFLNDLSYLPQYVLDNMDKFGKYIHG